MNTLRSRVNAAVLVFSVLIVVALLMPAVQRLRAMALDVKAADYLRQGMAYREFGGREYQRFSDPLRTITEPGTGQIPLWDGSVRKYSAIAFKPNANCMPFACPIQSSEQPFCIQPNLCIYFNKVRICGTNQHATLIAPFEVSGQGCPENPSDPCPGGRSPASSRSMDPSTWLEIDTFELLHPEYLRLLLDMGFTPIWLPEDEWDGFGGGSRLSFIDF